MQKMIWKGVGTAQKNKKEKKKRCNFTLNWLMIHVPGWLFWFILAFCLFLILWDVSITPTLFPLRSADIQDIEINFCLHTHKGVTSFCQREKIACFPLTSLYILLLGDRGVNISYYGDCTSTSKLLTFLVVYGRLECVCLCACVCMYKIDKANRGPGVV